ncbi:MAG: hypothetical protein FWG35_03980, partial [Spirochaetaceae bacterium]|nr:hypothetical protein [Spirochaetaceae bacterium]
TSAAVVIHSGTAISDLSGIAANGEGNYILTRSISVTAPRSFTGNPGYFAGTLDGNGNSISVNIPSAYTGNRVGIFSGIAADGEVKNLRLTGSINLASSTGPVCAGALAGENLGSIKNVSSRVNLSLGNNNYYIYGGGLIGNNSGEEAIIQNCYTTGSVTVTGRYVLRVGGIIGNQENRAKVINCWASGSVNSGGDSNQQSAGGIAGVVMSSGGTVDTCAALNGTVAVAEVTNQDRGRVVGYILPAIAGNNFANSSMTGSASTSTAGGIYDDGTGVDLILTEQAGGGWWTGAGNWGAVWGGTSADEDKPWKWPESGSSKPVLFFETVVN